MSLSNLSHIICISCAKIQINIDIPKKKVLVVVKFKLTLVFTIL